MSSTAIAVAAPITAVVPFQPSSVTEALELATMLAQSSLIPVALQKHPADVLVVILTGREYALSSMQAMRGMYVQNGRAIFYADQLVALVRRSGLCNSFRVVESNERRAVYETKRHGEPSVRLEWTIDMAKRAGLAGKDNWQHYPSAMLRARCKADLCRAVYEDVTQGILTSEEVADGVIDVTPESRELPITVADKTVEEWQREAEDLRVSIGEAPDVSTLETMLPDLRVIPDEFKRPLQDAYGKRMAALAPPSANSKTASLKDKMRGAKPAEPTPKTITVEGPSGENLNLPTEPPAA